MKNRPYSEDQEFDIRLEYFFANRQSDEYKNCFFDEDVTLPFIQGQGRWFKSTPSRMARLEKLSSEIEKFHGFSRVQYRKTD